MRVKSVNLQLVVRKMEAADTEHVVPGCCQPSVRPHSHPDPSEPLLSGGHVDTRRLLIYCAVS